MARMTTWFLVLLLACGSALATAPKGYPFVAFDEGLRQAKEQNKRVFLYFGRFGCAWCDQVNKQTFVDPELRALYIQNYVLVYVDAESGKRLRLSSGGAYYRGEPGRALQGFCHTPVPFSGAGRQGNCAHSRHSDGAEFFATMTAS